MSGDHNKGEKIQEELGNKENWDYHAPKFCDFSAPDTWKANPKDDEFFGKVELKKEERSQRTTPSVNRFRSMAEILKDFEQNTRSVDRNKTPITKPRFRFASATKLVSPKLRTTQRQRQQRPLTDAEKAQNQIKKYAFKATPFNRQLFESRKHIGIPKIVPLATTRPKTIQFATDKLAEKRKQKAVE